MWNLLKSELLKLRRCQILLVGLVALALCPLVQYGSQLIVEAEYRNPNYDFSALFENVVWGNTQIFLPISLVMIGGWLIDRESTHDTLKNIMTIPVSMPKMLGAKLLLVGMLAVLLGIYSVGITLITGLTVGLSGLTAEVFFHGGTQIVLAAGDLFGLYAADPDFWADPRGISGRFHSGVLPWIQHVVFQKWYPCQHLSVLCCADFSGI
mgnify:CR=1 FL=1